MSIAEGRFSLDFSTFSLDGVHQNGEEQNLYKCLHCGNIGFTFRNLG